MRAAILALIAGCGGAPLAARSEQRQKRTTCDFDLDTSTRRAWLTGGSVPVTLLDVSGRDLLVATVRDDVIATRWAPFDALAPAVTAKTSISPRAGAPGDPAIHVLAGFPLPATAAPWIAIHATGALELSGFIPASARGLIWEEPTSAPHPRVRVDLVVRAGPSLDAPVRGVIHPGAQVRVIATFARAPWVEVEAIGSHASVTGFVEPPPPSPRRTSEEEAERELEVFVPHAWWPLGTCLYDAPEGQIVGRVIGAVVERPTAGTNGWSSIVVTTGWGDVRYHAHAALLEPAAPEPFEWPFSSEWREN